MNSCFVPIFINHMIKQETMWHNFYCGKNNFFFQKYIEYILSLVTSNLKVSKTEKVRHFLELQIIIEKPENVEKYICSHFFEIFLIQLLLAFKFSRKFLKTLDKILMFVWACIRTAILILKGNSTLEHILEKIMFFQKL